MSLTNNSDFEVISNAEVSAIINQYSLENVELTLNEILSKRSVYRITPIANLVASYEINIQNNIRLYPDLQENLLERRIEMYMLIIDTVCKYYGLSYQISSEDDIYSSAYYIYQFLVSDFYKNCISFYVNFLQREAGELSRMVESYDKMIPVNTYAKKRYTGKQSNIAVIHTNLNYVLDMISNFDIKLTDIISLIVQDPGVAGFLSRSLFDNGDFYRRFYVPAVNMYNRADAITDIRLNLMPIAAPIADYIENDTEGE